MQTKRFIELLQKCDFNIFFKKKGEKLYIAFDFEENKGKFKNVLNLSTEIDFETFRYELAKYEKITIKEKTIFIFYNFEG